MFRPTHSFFSAGYIVLVRVEGDTIFFRDGSHVRRGDYAFSLNALTAEQAEKHRGQGYIPTPDNKKAYMSY